jgi:hypothetical protein
VIASPEPSYQQFTPEIAAFVAAGEKTRFDAERAKAAGKASGERRKALKDPKPVAPVLNPLEVYKERRLNRVRKQLDVLQDCFDEAIAGRMYTLAKDGKPVQVFDPQHIDRLSASIGRVAELERQLSDWALPGSKRPKPERQTRSSAAQFDGQED